MEIHQGDCFNKSKYYSKGLIRIVLKFYFTITQPNLFPISPNTNNPINKNKNKKKKEKNNIWKRRRKINIRSVEITEKISSRIERDDRVERQQEGSFQELRIDRIAAYPRYTNIPETGSRSLSEGISAWMRQDTAIKLSEEIQRAEKSWRARRWTRRGEGGCEGI